MRVEEGEERRAVASIVARIADIDAEAWDACANPDAATFNPFIAHAFLNALEASGSVGERHTGWIPQHITVDDGEGGIAACAPCYVKLNSAGEYVFDHSWASAYEHAGGRYYPKLQIAVPFTPVPGRRMLVRPGPDEAYYTKVLGAAAAELCDRIGASSVHATFLSEREWKALGARGYLLRNDQQFHWRNEGYATFEDFLGSLASRKRKAVRKEREQALSGDLVIERISGADIKEKHWDAFFDFYTDTGSRKWGRPYLNRRFFSLLGASMADRCLLIMAKRGAPLRRRRAQPHRRRLPLRPLLGLGRASPLPAFRGLLLSGDRLRHRAWPRPRRSGRAGRAQAGARLYADDDLLGALDRRSGLAARHRALPAGRARGRRRERRRAGRVRPLPQRRAFLRAASRLDGASGGPFNRPCHGVAMLCMDA